MLAERVLRDEACERAGAVQAQRAANAALAQRLAALDADNRALRLRASMWEPQLDRANTALKVCPLSRCRDSFTGKSPRWSGSCAGRMQGD